MKNGRAVELSIENEICNAILVAWFGGEAGAKAIAEALTGKISPAGRLPVSMPRSTGAVPCYYSMLPGRFSIMVGASSRDIRLTGEVVF